MHRKLLIFLAGLAAGLPLAPILTHLDGGSAGLPDIPLVRAPAFSDSAQLLLTSALPPQDPAMLSRVIPAVVRVTGPAFAGSGVIVTPSGAVLTSAHVVGEAAQVGVVVEDNRSVTGRVVLADAKRDLALVQLPEGAYPSVPLAGGEAPSLGSQAVAIGYPLGLPGPASVTTGVVSRLIHEPDLGRTLLQTDAAINLGNSGGPIVDHRGAIIGIVASVMGEYQSVPARGISFAVSAETIHQEFLPAS
jgi:S1-C subfamily serine protease